MNIAPHTHARQPTRITPPIHITSRHPRTAQHTHITPPTHITPHHPFTSHHPFNILASHMPPSCSLHSFPPINTSFHITSPPHTRGPSHHSFTPPPSPQYPPHSTITTKMFSETESHNNRQLGLLIFYDVVMVR